VVVVKVEADGLDGTGGFGLLEALAAVFGGTVGPIVLLVWAGVEIGTGVSTATWPSCFGTEAGDAEVEDERLARDESRRGLGTGAGTVADSALAKAVVVVDKAKVVAPLGLAERATESRRGLGTGTGVSADASGT